MALTFKPSIHRQGPEAGELEASQVHRLAEVT